jgi:hypothetical protein
MKEREEAEAGENDEVENELGMEMEDGDEEEDDDEAEDEEGAKELLRVRGGEKLGSMRRTSSRGKEWGRKY